MTLFKLEIRMDAPLTQEQEDELRTLRINSRDGDFEDISYRKQVQKHYYLPVTLNLDDVELWRPEDSSRTHTLLYMANDTVAAKVDYDMFNAIIEMTR